MARTGYAPPRTRLVCRLREHFRICRHFDASAFAAAPIVEYRLENHPAALRGGVKWLGESRHRQNPPPELFSPPVRKLGGPFLLSSELGGP